MSFPTRYEVQGAGSPETNGIYEFVALFNDRPYYRHTQGTAWLWFFSAPFLLKTYTGWYLSKRVGSSALSAADDFYAAYGSLPLPPASRWVTRSPGWGPTAGCGREPAPQSVLPIRSTDPGRLSTDEPCAQQQQQEEEGHSQISSVAIESTTSSAVEDAGRVSLEAPMEQRDAIDHDELDASQAQALEQDQQFLELDPSERFEGTTINDQEGGGFVLVEPDYDDHVDAVQPEQHDNEASRSILTSSTVRLFPRSYKVDGAGSTEVDGTYLYGGVFNGRPFYQQCGTERSLWYFDGAGITASWSGWYLSKKRGTSGMSAKPDYYTAYVKSTLPPIHGWVVRRPGLLPTAGRGRSPAPTVMINDRDYVSDNPLSSSEHEGEETDLGQSLSLLEQVDNTVRDSFPPIYKVCGAGLAFVNGTYKFGGIFNGKPFYHHEHRSDAVLWYFSATLWPISSFTGWYISKDLCTTSLSSARDYYSVYCKTELPPASGWVTREPGMSPTAGCGVAPAPFLLVESTALATPNATATSGPIDGVAMRFLAMQLRSAPPFIPYQYAMRNCHNTLLNGVYTYVGWSTDNRPFYRLTDGDANAAETNLQQQQQQRAADEAIAGRPVLWFSESKAVVDTPSWLISDRLHANEHYCVVACTEQLPPSSGWRVVSSAPTAVASTSAHLTLEPFGTGKLVRLTAMVPSGDRLEVVARLDRPVQELVYSLAETTEIPIYSIVVTHNQVVLDRSIELQQYKIQNGYTIQVARVAPMIASRVPNEQKTIVVVGGGPVGLWTAIQLKILAPQWRIVCREKRGSYVRSHALRIDAYSFNEMVSSSQEFTTLARSFAPRTRTATVETELSKFALAVGIEYTCNASVESDLSLLTNDLGQRPDAVICCDGARSVFRRQLCQDLPSEYAVERQLGSLLQIKFDAVGLIERNSGALAAMRNNLPARQYFFNVLTANFDEATNTTPMTIFSLVNNEIYAQLAGDTTSATPALSVSALDTRLQDGNQRLTLDIQGVLDHVCPAGIVPGSLRISALPASYYVTARAAGILTHGDHQVPVFLAGDAAMGLSLEKGLCYGWAISSRLAHLLAYCTVPEALEYYSAIFQKISSRAVAHVQSDYAAYEVAIRRASAVRTFLQALPFRFTANT